MRLTTAICFISLLLSTSCVSRVRTGRFRELPPAAAPAEAAVESISDEDEYEDSYKEALEFYLLKRAPAGQELPVERYLDARRHAERMPQYVVSQRRFAARAENGLAGADLGQWQPLGPGNIGGRTRSLVIHPDNPKIMYAGGVGGGVWKTTDGGESWRPMSDLMPSVAVNALAMDPKDPETLYAGTGENYSGDGIRGLGIFKTTDGGETWNLLQATSSSSFWYTNRIVVSPVDHQRIYAATYGGVWYSPDGGVRWTRVLDRRSPNLGCQDVVIRSDQTTDYVFAACVSRASGTTSAIFRNTDASGNGKWEQVFSDKNLDRASLALAPSDQSIIYALAASRETGNNQFGLLGVYRSASNGDAETWEARATVKDDNRINRVLLTNPSGAFNDVCSGGNPTFSNQGDYDNSIAVDPYNPDVVWAGGIDVFRSDDGGANWGIAAFWQATGPRLVHADVHVLLFPPNYGAKPALYAATDGGIFRTDNPSAETATGLRAGCSPYPTSIEWKSLNNGYAVTQFYHGAVYPGGMAYAAGAQDNGTSRGADGWGSNGWRSIRGGDGGYVAIDPQNPNNVYTESQYFNLGRSTDGGQTFFVGTRGITESLTTTDFLFIAPYEMDPKDPATLYAGGHTLWRTTDGAQNWKAASAPIGNSNGKISTIAIAPSDSTRVVFGTSSGYIYRTADVPSADKSTNWDAVRPRNDFVSHLAFDPTNPDVIYATYSPFNVLATDSHVYKSIDGGVTWKGIDGFGDFAIPDVPVFTIVIDPQNPSNLYLGTDIGLFVSMDAGASWARDNNPFANTPTEALVLDRSSGQGNLFAFTHGRGVWRTTLPGSGDPCRYDVGDLPRVPAFGGAVTLNVVAGNDCAWSALGTSDVTVRSPAGGKGKSDLGLTIAPNNTAAVRNNVVWLQGKPVQVPQEAAIQVDGNDEKATAADLGNLPAVIIENTSGGTESADDPVHTCTRSADAKSLWFRFTAAETGTFRLTYNNRRLDTGTDSGTVVNLYSATGTEMLCSVVQQSTLTTTRTVQGSVKSGDTLFIEVSATIFGAAPGATPLAGNLTLTAQIIKP